MLKAGKISIAIVMGLALSLTLLVSGVSAQDTTSAQTSASAGTRSFMLADSAQQGTQQLFPTSHAQQGKANLAGVWCGRYRCHARYYRRYYRYNRVRCSWFRRGWGRWRRTVRVCRAGW